MALEIDDAMATITELATDQEYDDFVKSEELSVVHFYSSWAQQCTYMNNVIKELMKLEEYKEVKFAKIDAETVSEVSLKCDVAHVPTILILRKGGVKDQVHGADAAVMIDKIRHQLSNKNAPLLDTIRKKEPLEDKLRKLVNRSECMLFMKGTPTSPKCGFSRLMCTILNRNKVKYAWYDIIEDKEVREGLKVFSKWPTYPQLYLNGELIGGVDIVRDMEDSGEIEEKGLPRRD